MSMKKIFKQASLIAALAIFASCSVTTPLAVSHAPIGNKVGTSSTVVFLGIHFNKNWSVAEAAHNGGIKGGVATVDHKLTNYVFFVKRELIVTGE